MGGIIGGLFWFIILVAIIVVAIVVIAIVAILAFRDKVSELWEAISTGINSL